MTKHQFKVLAGLQLFLKRIKISIFQTPSALTMTATSSSVADYVVKESSELSPERGLLS